MSIRLLPEHLVNQIAAGEVVERPLSIIKELLENSIDADASKIKIICRNGGKSFLEIIDNGCGMNKDDLALCIKKHTTSKLPENTLNNIQTMGFRGEALAAISTVSRTTISSKQKDQQSDDNHGWKININGGKLEAIEPINMDCGTIVTIRDLFFCVPARLKFLKSNAVEIRHIMDAINSLALSHPKIHFTLENNDKIVYDYPIEKVSIKETITAELTSNEENEYLLGRIQQVLGKGVLNNCVKVEYKEGDLNIRGFACVPTFNRPTSAWQYFYIRNRYVKNKFFHYATKAAYHDYLPANKAAVVILFLDCNNMSFDINVEPDKTSVRFVDEQSVKSSIIKALRKAISKVSNTTSSILHHEFMEKISKPKEIPKDNVLHLAKASPISNSTITERAKLSFEDNPSFSSNTSSPKPLINSTPITTVLENNNAKLPDKLPSIVPNENTLGQPVAQVHKTYVISETKEGIVIVDQHAVHERLVYENLKKEYMTGQVVTQALALPITVSLSQTESLILKEHGVALKEMGLWLEDIMEQSCIVRGLPVYLADIDAETLLHDVCAQLQEFDTSCVLKDKANEILGNFACHHSIRAGKIMSTQEMESLLRKIETTQGSAQCNHGRPSYIKISKKELDRMFHRK